MQNEELEIIIARLASITPERFAEILGRPVEEVRAELEAARQPLGLTIDDVGQRVTFAELEARGQQAVLDALARGEP